MLASPCWWNGPSSQSDRRATRGMGAARPTNGGRPRAGGKPRRPRCGDKTRRQASRFHGTRAPASHQDRHDSVTPALAPAESWERGRANGMPRPGVIRLSPAAPRLLKSQSHSGASDGGVNPGPLTGPTRTKGSPADSLGRELDGPLTRAGSLPSLLSQRTWEPDLPGHMAAPRPSASGQSHAG